MYSRLVIVALSAWPPGVNKLCVYTQVCGDLECAVVSAPKTRGIKAQLRVYSRLSYKSLSSLGIQALLGL
jgi:hypothetical protein